MSRLLDLTDSALAIQEAMDEKTLAENVRKIIGAAGENAKVAVENTKQGVAIKVTLYTKKP